MSTALLASSHDIADILREPILARVTEALSSDEAVQAIMAIPTQVSQYVPAPDMDTIDFNRAMPAGLFQILVWHDRADVVLTYCYSLSGQMASQPVANAAALRDLATYVVLAAGGDIGAAPTIYAAPEWLIRQVEVVTQSDLVEHKEAALA